MKKQNFVWAFNQTIRGLGCRVTGANFKVFGKILHLETTATCLNIFIYSLPVY